MESQWGAGFGVDAFAVPNAARAVDGKLEVARVAAPTVPAARAPVVNWRRVGVVGFISNSPNVVEGKTLLRFRKLRGSAGASGWAKRCLRRAHRE